MAWLGTVMIWILIQEILGNKEKSLENDDLVPTLQCMDAGNWRGKDSHLLMKISLLKVILDDSAPSLPSTAKSKLLLRGRQFLLVLLVFSSSSELLF